MALQIAALKRRAFHFCNLTNSSAFPLWDLSRSRRRLLPLVQDRSLSLVTISRRSRDGRSLLFRHRVFNEANDRHDNSSAHAALCFASTLAEPMPHCWRAGPVPFMRTLRKRTRSLFPTSHCTRACTLSTPFLKAKDHDHRQDHEQAPRVIVFRNRANCFI